MMSLRTWAQDRRVPVSAMLGLSMLWELIRFVLLSTTGSRIADDAFLVWRPLASAVQSGTPLYLAEAVDNKPPLWLFQQVLSGASPDYVVTNLVLIGLANWGIAVAIWYLVDRRLQTSESPNIGLLAALLFLLAAPVMGVAISNKNAGVLFVLLAVTQSGPYRTGGSLGIAGLFAQQAIFATPVVAWIAGRRAESGWSSWVGRFIVGGLAVVALGFLGVAAIWGPTSAIRGLQLTAGLVTPRSGTGTYFLGGLGREQSLLVNPAQWGYSMYVVVQSIYFLLVPALVGLVSTSDERGAGEDVVRREFALLGGFLGLSLLIRPFRNYWVLLLPSLAVLAALGYSVILREWSSEVVSGTREEQGYAPD